MTLADEISLAYSRWVVSLSLGWRSEDWYRGRLYRPLDELQDLAFVEDAERDVEALLQ